MNTENGGYCFALQVGLLNKVLPIEMQVKPEDKITEKLLSKNREIVRQSEQKKGTTN